MQPGEMPPVEAPPPLEAPSPLEAPPPVEALPPVEARPVEVTRAEPVVTMEPPAWSPQTPAPAPVETRAEGFWTAAGGESSQSQPETRWDTAFHRGQGTPFPTTPPVEPPPPTPNLPPPAYGITPSPTVTTYGMPPGQQAPTYGAPPGQPAYGSSYGAQPGQPAYGSAYGAPPGQPAPAYGPPGQSAPVPGPWSPAPQQYGAPPPGPGRRGRTAIVIAGVVAVLVAGGGAFAAVTLLTGKHHPGSAPSSTPTIQSSATTPSASASSSPAASSSPTASPTASPTGSPTPSGITAGTGVEGNPAEPGVVAFLNSYFAAINAHDYAAYNALLDPQLQKNNSQSTFDSGYATTKDSAETLTRIADTGGGGEAATVSFTSHQNPADTPTHTECTSWTITLYLEPNGTGYLEGPPPAGYHASYQAC